VCPGVGEEPLVNISIWDILKAADEPQVRATSHVHACCSPSLRKHSQVFEQACEFLRLFAKCLLWAPLQACCGRQAGIDAFPFRAGSVNLRKTSWAWTLRPDRDVVGLAAQRLYLGIDPHAQKVSIRFTDPALTRKDGCFDRSHRHALCAWSTKHTMRACGRPRT